MTDLKSYLRQEPNHRMFGLFRFTLGLYNLSGNDSTKWFNRWVRNAGTPPVIYDPMLMENSRLQMEKAMFNKLSREQAEKYVQPDLSRYKYILSQYLSPEINPKMLEQFAQAELFPSAGVFINRGLARAVMQMCGKCGMGARIFLEKIPIASQTMEMAREINMDAVTAALNGGEDYELLFTVAMDDYEKVIGLDNVGIVGHMTKPELGFNLVGRQGEEIALKAQGWNSLEG